MILCNNECTFAVWFAVGEFSISQCIVCGIIANSLGTAEQMNMLEDANRVIREAQA